MTTPISFSFSDANDRKFGIYSKAPSSINPFQNAFNNTPEFTNVFTNSLSQTASKLSNFRVALENLKNGDNYSNTSASVHYGTSVLVNSAGAKTGTHTLKVDQLATAHTASSDAVAETGTALGKQGTIYLNKTTISITATDSLTDIMNSINYGEDSDHNGKLEFKEDRNNNGSIDTIAGTASQPGFTEDANGNGILDGTEDTNNNKKLDGGTQEHHVKATIQDNKLVLQLDHTGKDEIKITDDNQVMESLGIITYNTKNEVSFKNTIQAAQKAKITIDGKTHTSDSNTLSEAIDNLDITLQKSDNASEVTVKISSSTSDLVDHVKTIVNAVNSLVTDIKTNMPTAHYAVSNPSDQIGKDLLRTINSIKTTDNSVATHNTLKLGDIGLTVKEDGTLSLDEAKLSKIATDDLKSVKRLLTDSKQGLVPKLSAFAEKHLEKSGSITLTKQVVASFLDQYNAFPYNSRVQMEIYSARNQLATQLELFNRDA